MSKASLERLSMQGGRQRVSACSERRTTEPREQLLEQSTAIDPALLLAKLVDEHNLNGPLQRRSQPVQVSISVLRDGLTTDDGATALASVVAIPVEAESSAIVLDKLTKHGHAGFEGDDEGDCGMVRGVSDTTPSVRRRVQERHALLLRTPSRGLTKASCRFDSPACDLARADCTNRRRRDAKPSPSSSESSKAA